MSAEFRAGFACLVGRPNAGKSTFLRATGLAVLLAHLGAGVPAASMEFVPAGTLFTSIELADDLTAGQSGRRQRDWIAPGRATETSCPT